jgi:hypothetical protein
MNKMVQMEEQMELQEKHTEIIKGGFSSSHSTTSTDPTYGLSKKLVDLDMKGS